ncbi:MAG TPA: hypothetical protein VGG33_01215, partial [Polyangia bacterium]
MAPEPGRASITTAPRRPFPSHAQRPTTITSLTSVITACLAAGCSPIAGTVLGGRGRSGGAGGAIHDAAMAEGGSPAANGGRSGNTGNAGSAGNAGGRGGTEPIGSGGSDGNQAREDSGVAPDAAAGTAPIPPANCTPSKLFGRHGELWKSDGRLIDPSYAGYHTGLDPIPTVDGPL